MALEEKERCCLDIDQETLRPRAVALDVAYRICGIAAPWHYGPVALRPVPESKRHAPARSKLIGLADKTSSKD